MFTKKIIFFVMVLSVMTAVCFASAIPIVSNNRMTPTVKAVKKALPWVVSIGTTQQIIQVNDPFSLFFTDFFNQPRRVVTQFSPLGSGVIVDESGLVLTNYHVVRRASSIEVQLWDGTSFSADVVGYDVDSDLCLLKLQGEVPQLTAAEYARVDDLYLGETVIAIGNPFGLGQSVSTGVLSALNRSFQEGDVDFENLIQTDAAINPGNSGGPLVNLDGQLVGINQAIRADAQGICFAIPLSHIEPFLSFWLKPAHFSDAFLGIPTNAILQSADYSGVLLPAPIPNSPLAKAGLQEGDRIFAVNGNSVKNPIEFGHAIWKLKSGDTVMLSTNRGELTLTLEPQPDEMLIGTRLGISLAPLTDAMRSALGLRQNQEALIVSDVQEEPFGSIQGAQWKEVIRRGDILLQFAEQEYPTFSQIADSLRGSKAGEYRYMVFYSSAVKMPVEVARLQLN